MSKDKRNKMDRTFSRTPSDVERKYGLGQSPSAPGSSITEEQFLNLSQTVSQYLVEVTKLKADIAELKLEIKVLKNEIEALKNPKITYTVKFFDVNNVEIASYTVNEGESVEAPPQTDVKWVDGEGVEVIFPYTPTSDINLYVYQESTL